MRDLSAIGSKIVLILYPAGSSSSKAVLRDWDLWGPLVACLGLAVVLSVNGTFLCTSLSLSLSTLFDFQLPLIKMTDARLLLVFFFFALQLGFVFRWGIQIPKAPPQQSLSVFTGVFVIVWVGSLVVTLNARLLGGRVSLLQSLCVLGYCLFPLFIAALVALFIRWLPIRVLLSITGWAWSVWGKS